MKFKEDKPISFKLTKNQKKAFDKLRFYGFNRSQLITIAIDEYLHKNYRKIIENETKEKLPF